MSGYEVVIAALRRSAEAARGAGEQAGAIDLAAALAGVPGALPGSRSGHAAAGLAEAWRALIADWSRTAVALGDGMAASADLYETNEQAAEADLTASGSRVRAI